ncbi:uncharacterized protein LOC113851954 [Abrus precatorius]|uniref:Uncharacterized protein LOC113851954 n=1 Tax=Abrus precatorius TaxID=3816 RepID=A0A8B8K2L9_ABRPR|nr:uncharacterized protein LOC113851954 [Abrus precatorius]
MAGRGRGVRGTNDLMERMAKILETLAHNQGGEPTEYVVLSSFTRHDPPKFEGGFDPKGAQRWLASMEKIFHAMGCCEEHKVNYVTYMLCGEAEDWWRFTIQTRVATFRSEKQKAKKFLELKQEIVTVGEYAAKFQELMKYWPHYQYEDGEEDLCAQFEHGLRPNI